MPNKKALERRMESRVRAARVGVKAAGKLRITPEPGVVAIAERSLAGDKFNASQYLKPNRLAG